MAIKVKPKIQATGSAPAATHTNTVNFLKVGAAAAKAVDEHKAAAEAAKQEQGKLWRFRIGKENLGEDFRITFLDGELLGDGSLSAPVWDEHMLLWNGKWQTFIAPTNEPDPIAESTPSKAQLKFGLTVIDWTEYESNGKTYKARKKLFVGTHQTYEVMKKMASKYGNGSLVGLTFDVSRSTDRSPAVGDTFMYIEKMTVAKVAEKLKEAHGDKYDETMVEPANLNEELVYRTRAELMKLGFGAGVSVGGEKPSKDLNSEM